MFIFVAKSFEQECVWSYSNLKAAEWVGLKIVKLQSQREPIRDFRLQISQYRVLESSSSQTSLHFFIMIIFFCVGFFCTLFFSRAHNKLCL